MATLFEIVGDFQNLYAMATDPDTDPEAFEGSLESLTAELEVKGTGYVQVIKQLEMEQAQAEAISKQFKEKADTRKRNIERMKDKLLYAMEVINQDKIEAGDWTIKVQNNGGQAPIVIDGDVPDNMTKVTIEPDKTKIRDYLTALDGQSCEWAHIAERGKHIVIK